ncbi:MAG: 23S rRNA (adenine(2503)-C(2))-methyltransferase RlmN [Deltaproteobacteria bacterium]|nr:MAG: 23S rRNA (adenine(2503)-C(2))-methyltransferase RlmN [Deltaproteobacteria bacterium]
MSRNDSTPDNPHPSGVDIKELTLPALTAWLEAGGIKPFHASQIFKWIYARQVDDFNEMTDLGKQLRIRLMDHFVVNRLQQVAVEKAADGTRKYLFGLADGNFIESVLIPEKNHLTLCISSQVGCAQRCRFCLTGTGGFIRNLSSGEILAQVRDIRNELGDADKLTNLVFMGMGEPLANYDNLIAALAVITDNRCGMAFSANRVTLSTAGLVPKIIRLGRDAAVSLAVSLNATNNQTRDQLMPINRRYPIETLIDACRNYPLKKRRKITFEYILIKGINDSPDDAERLARLLNPSWAKINLIPFNEFPESRFLRPAAAVIERFMDILHQRQYVTIIRASKGRDISAACGQLRVRVAESQDQ